MNAPEEPEDLQRRLLREMQSGAGLTRAVRHASRYQANVLSRNVAPTAAAIAGLAAFDQPMPEEPRDPTRLLDQLDASGGPATVAQTGGRFFGLVNGAVLPAALAARVLADTWDQNAVLYAVSPVSSMLESVCERWLRELFDLPASVTAGFVSGTSMATVCGLAAARWRLLHRAGWDVNARGLRDAPELRIVTGRHAHSTVLKAAALLGLGTANFEWVEVDDEGRLRADSLPQLDDRTIVILQAGNVNSGAFDPLREVAELARAAGAWIHVDGAFGLWAAASTRFRHLTDGHELATSWSVDAHKTLNAPYDSGVVLCADAEALVAALQNDAPYIMFSEQRDGMLYTPEMSRRARAIELWAALASLGRSGLADLLALLHRRACQFAQRLKEEGFEVLNDVVFNQVLTAGRTPDETAALIERVQRSGRAWLGGSSWFGRPVIRISVCSWATTEADVEEAVAALVAARDLAERPGRETIPAG